MQLNFTFHSSDHLRYEHGHHVSGPHGGANRVVTVQPNISGCRGYDVEPGDGYIVTIFNADGNHPIWRNNVQMAPKPMRIVQQSAEKVVLRGFPILAQGPFGWVDFPGDNYGLTIYLEDGQVAKCVLHMHEREVDIEYLS